MHDLFLVTRQSDNHDLWLAALLPDGRMFAYLPAGQATEPERPRTTGWFDHTALKEEYAGYGDGGLQFTPLTTAQARDRIAAGFGPDPHLLGDWPEPHTTRLTTEDIMNTYSSTPIPGGIRLTHNTLAPAKWPTIVDLPHNAGTIVYDYGQHAIVSIDITMNTPITDPSTPDTFAVNLDWLQLWFGLSPTDLGADRIRIDNSYLYHDVTRCLAAEADRRWNPAAAQSSDTDYRNKWQLLSSVAPSMQGEQPQTLPLPARDSDGTYPRHEDDTRVSWAHPALAPPATIGNGDLIIEHDNAGRITLTAPAHPATGTGVIPPVLTATAWDPEGRPVARIPLTWHDSVDGPHFTGTLADAPDGWDTWAWEVHHPLLGEEPPADDHGHTYEQAWEELHDQQFNTELRRWLESDGDGTDLDTLMASNPADRSGQSVDSRRPPNLTPGAAAVEDFAASIERELVTRTARPSEMPDRIVQRLALLKQRLEALPSDVKRPALLNHVRRTMQRLHQAADGEKPQPHTS